MLEARSRNLEWEMVLNDMMERAEREHEKRTKSESHLVGVDRDLSRGNQVVMASNGEDY